MLCLQDLNTLIKYFALQIPIRINEFLTQAKNNEEKEVEQEVAQLEQQVEEIKNKSEGLKIPKESGGDIRKMCERIIQIFGFYRWRGRSQGVLSQFERHIHGRMNIITNEVYIDVAKIVSLILDISRKGIIFPIKSFPLRKYVTSSISKSSRKFSAKPSPSPSNTLPPEACKRRAVSVMCSTSQLNPVVEVISRLYSCMQIDKNHLSRVIESEKFLRRDQMRRNKSALKRVLHGEREKEKLEGKGEKKEKDKECRENKDSKDSKGRDRVYESLLKKKDKGDVERGHERVLAEQQTNIKVIGMVKESDDILSSKAPVLNLGIFGKRWSKVKTACRKRNEENRQTKDENMQFT